MNTNEIMVLDVGEDIRVAVNGEVRRVSWDVLRNAASQDDQELAACFAGSVSTVPRRRGRYTVYAADPLMHKIRVSPYAGHGAPQCKTK